MRIGTKKFSATGRHHFRSAVCLLTCILICLRIIVPPSVALADPCKEAVPLVTGEPAPCDGVLYPEKLVKEHLRLRVDFEELTRKLTIERDLHENQLAAYRLQLQTAEKNVNRLSNPPWYEKPEINRWLGVGLGIVLSVATVFAINQSTR